MATARSNGHLEKILLETKGNEEVPLTKISPLSSVSFSSPENNMFKVSFGGCPISVIKIYLVDTLEAIFLDVSLNEI